MTNRELAEFNKNRKICQIAFVCRDIEKTMQKWVDTLNVGPWLVLTFENSTLEDFRIDGEPVSEPFKFIVGLSNIGDTQIELVEQVYGPLAYEKFLNEKGEGLHHIKEQMSVEDIRRTTEAMKEKGVGVAQTGLFGGVDIHCVFDSERVLNFIYEVGNNPEFDLPKELYYIYPREDA
jgi:methylmalonyl-CoA/ethylmalonyl-CoA epimerase